MRPALWTSIWLILIAVPYTFEYPCELCSAIVGYSIPCISNDSSVLIMFRLPMFLLIVYPASSFSF